MKRSPSVTAGRAGRGQAWMRDARCGEHPDVYFFAVEPRSTAAAKRVRGDCLPFAVTEGLDAGIWGGLT